MLKHYSGVEGAKKGEWGGAHRHVIYVPSLKRTNINELYLLCQFIEIVHKIINCYMKNAK